MREYKTKAGVVQLMPSVRELEELDADGDGWCLHCGNTQPAEPDAVRYTCEACGLPKVYGAAELALRGICH